MDNQSILDVFKTKVYYYEDDMSRGFVTVECHFQIDILQKESRIA